MIAAGRGHRPFGGDHAIKTQAVLRRRQPNHRGPIAPMS